jgi:hypothetical protein
MRSSRRAAAIVAVVSTIGLAFEMVVESWPHGKTGSFQALAAEPLYGTAGFLPQSVMTTSQPAAWDAGKGQMMATIMSSCTAPFQASIAGLQTAMGGGFGMGGGVQAPSCPLAMGVTIETQCPLGDQPIDSSAVSCQNFNEALINQMTSQLSSAYCAAACKSAKLAAVKQELQCVQAMASNINMQAQSLGTMFQQNIRRMQAQVFAYKSAIADRTAQLEDTTGYLMGDQQSGRTGLIKLKDDTDKLIATMPAQIQAVRQRQQTMVQWQKSLDGQVSMKKISDAMKCFNTQPMSGYKCTLNDTQPRSSKEALLCQFKASSQIGKNGIVERNQTVINQGQSTEAQLASILDQMSSEAPADAKIPTSQQDLANNGQQTRIIMSPSDVKARYYDRLSKFKIGNSNAGDIVMASMNYCYDTATKRVAADKKDANSLIGQANFNINTEKNAVLDQIKPLYQQYNKQYSENIKALTGSNLPLNTTACEKAVAETQIRCLEDIRKNMTGQYYGTSSNSQMKIQIKGNNPQSHFSFSCSGIMGCVTNLQNVSRNLKIDMKKLENDKNGFIMSANKSTEDYAQMMAQQLNGPSMMLQAKLNALAGAVRDVGGNMPNAHMKIRPEPTQLDEDKLIRPPMDPLAFIGKSVTPPLPDVNAVSSASLPGSIDSLPRIMTEFAKVSTMKQTCAAQATQDAVSQLSSISASNCHNHPLCQSRFEQLTKDISGLSGRPGIAPGTGTSLMTGIQMACDNSNAGPGKPDPAEYPGDPKGFKLALRQYNEDRRYTGQMYNPQGCAAYLATLQGTIKQIQMTSGTGTGMPGSSRGW